MPEPSVNPSVSGQIHTGFLAEQTIRRKFGKFLIDKARAEYQVSAEKAPALARRALTAAINTLRHNGYSPNLFGRMLQDQVLAAQLQPGQLHQKQRDALMQQQWDSYVEYAGNYARRHVGRCWPGTLTLPQEALRDEAMELFFVKLGKPDFVLTSALTTYLTGIMIRLIRVLSREQNEPGLTGQRSKTTTSPPDTASRLVLLERIRFYRQAHRLIAGKLDSLSPTCRTIILRHYGIDEQRIGEMTQPPEPLESLTETEFNGLFDVALQAGGASRKLKDIADEVKLSPKQISDKHLECVDELVQAVVPILQQEADTSFSDTVRREMQDRLAEANHRIQTKKAQKQRRAAFK